MDVALLLRHGLVRGLQAPPLRANLGRRGDTWPIFPAALKRSKSSSAFRPRFEAQTARMASLAAASLADELANADMTHDLPAEKALALLTAEAEMNS